MIKCKAVCKLLKEKGNGGIWCSEKSTIIREMDDGGCLGAIIGGAIILYILSYILAFLLVILGIIAGVGALVGFVMALVSFINAIKCVVAERRSEDGRFKSEHAKLTYDSVIDKSTLKYEEIARNVYFMGPCFNDVNKIIKKSFEEMYAHDTGNTSGTFLGAVFGIGKKISIYVFGTIGTLVFSLDLYIISFVFCLLYSLIFGIALLIENIRVKFKKVSYRCTHCKKEYNLPIIICPVCGIKHMNLNPGRFGAYKRICICGAPLPVMLGSKTSYVSGYNGDGRKLKEVLEYNELPQICPNCRCDNNAGASHPISIALIGGASAGKTTFKVAFVHDFLDEEIPGKMTGVDVVFPTTAAEAEYEECCKQYIGKPIRATQTGMDHDIYTFAFMLKSNKFRADRMIQVYDMPGEAFQTGDVKEGWDIYTFTEGAVLLLDPYILPNIKQQNEEEIKGSSMANSKMDMDNLITAITDTLASVKVKKTKTGKYTIPIALVINKTDSNLLKQQVGDVAIRSLMREYPAKFTDYYITMDYVCRCFLNDNGGTNFIANLDNNFETVHFFSCSPMGFVPHGAVARFNPYNVLGIMQWIMLRADKELGEVWKPDNFIVDVPNEIKEYYKEHRDWYDCVVTNNLNYQTK